ncbi:MAG TPA: TadE/TadG family type IV pilus assembly protein [Chloroflexota bacterium]|nr:TadE/TadG family type IV pilus assembly protein [Chloroflexota bacterium]
MLLDAPFRLVRGWIRSRDRARLARPECRRGYRVRGQALAEFALIVPVFVLMVMIVVDLGRVFYTYEALANAAREGARYCAVHGHDTLATNVAAGTSARVTGELAGTVSNVTISAPNCVNNSGVATGSPVSVSVSTTFTPITPLISNFAFSGGSATISATATMMMQ